MTTVLPPLGLYVHLPWCIRKCPYCDFNSYEKRDALPEHDYIDALLRDLDAELPLVDGRMLTSVFIGGGTPSLFSGKAIAALLGGIRDRIATASDIEITLEANPGAAEAARFAEFRAAGVNRLSVGVQSLREAQLRALGRVHGPAEAVAAVTAAQRAGFENVNVDLMYGLPGDDPAGAVADLEQALALEPTHLSWYQLTLEPNTHFERHPPELPDDDSIAAIEAAGRELLANRGFERYEVSAYARPGFRCRHNLNYWEFGDYLGLGAGAHGKLMVAAGAIERRAKTRNPRTYLSLAGTAAAVTVERVDSPDALVTEFMMNALRLVDGVDAGLLMERTGQPLDRLSDNLREIRSRAWIADVPGRLQATPEGMQSLNRVLAAF
jgi:oxygen-independent coproporphyrinogen-3 oxidase